MKVNTCDITTTELKRMEEMGFEATVSRDSVVFCFPPRISMI